MTREDLFLAIGRIDDDLLADTMPHQEPSGEIWEDDMMNGRNKNVRFCRRIWLIAAIVALMLVLMGSGYAALIRMRAEEIPHHGGGKMLLNGGTDSGVHGGTEQTVDNERVAFEPVQDVYIELGSYYPQMIPDGYTITFVSEGEPLSQQSITYENNGGYSIDFWIMKGDEASNVEVYEIVEREDVQIHGESGILYTQKGDTRTLVWANTEQGFGFALRTNDPQVDLIVMAESTGEGEPLEQTRSKVTLEAIDELGNFEPTYLPEGFVAQGVMGSPSYEGGGWYGYVRRWYINQPENATIYFEYETYVIDTAKGYTDNALTICSFYIPGSNILEGEVLGEEVEVCGMFGLATDRHIVWADPENHVVYHIYSKEVTGEELLKVAQSICENTDN